MAANGGWGSKASVKWEIKAEIHNKNRRQALYVLIMIICHNGRL